MGHGKHPEHLTVFNTAISAGNSNATFCGTYSKTETYKRTYPQSFGLPSTQAGRLQCLTYYVNF